MIHHKFLKMQKLTILKRMSEIVEASLAIQMNIMIILIMKAVHSNLLHFQLSLIEPTTHDLPGAVSAADRQWARRAFPDPQQVLGTLY